MPIANLADRSPRWFVFLRFTLGRGWWWSEWQWLTTFQALSIAAAPEPGRQDIRVYYWDGSSTVPAFTNG